MVLTPERPRKPQRVKDYTKTLYDGLDETYDKTNGYMWTIKGETKPISRELEVWRNNDDTICIRQETHLNVELLRFTDGQAYGLLKALARCMEVC